MEKVPVPFQFTQLSRVAYISSFVQCSLVATPNSPWFPLVIPSLAEIWVGLLLGNPRAFGSKLTKNKKNMRHISILKPLKPNGFDTHSQNRPQTTCNFRRRRFYSGAATKNSFSGIGYPGCDVQAQLKTHLHAPWRRGGRKFPSPSSSRNFLVSHMLIVSFNDLW